MHFFGVFDGHGELGTECAQFAQDKVGGEALFLPACLTQFAC
jgi:serine/threonine protein phosphatase PrpC